MKPTICIECKGGIEKPRQGKIYCSEACKKRYHRAKQQTAIGAVEEQNAQEVLKLNFKASEFVEFERWCRQNKNPKYAGACGDLTTGRDSLETYCYFRKDLVQLSGFDDVITYYMSKGEDWIEDLWQRPSSEQAQDFDKFKLFFENDQVKFVD